jgi:hypothetical protein
MNQRYFRLIRLVIAGLTLSACLMLPGMAISQSAEEGTSAIVRLSAVSSTQLRAEGRAFRLTPQVEINIRGQRATVEQLAPGQLVRIVFRGGQLVLVEQVEETS